MSESQLLHGQFITSERSPVGAVIMAGRHIDMPRLPTHPARTLDNYALVLVIAGRSLYENAAGAREFVKPGDLMLIFPGVWYRYAQAPHTPAGLWSEWWAHFEGPAFDLWRTRGLLDPTRPIIHAGSPRYWLRRLDAVAPPGGGSRRSHEGSPSQLRRVSMLQQVLAEAMEHERTLSTAPEDEAWIAKVSEQLEPSFGRDRPDWDKISRQSGMSYEGFRKRFTKLMGVAPAHYHASRVLQRACDLLHRPELSLSAIAEMCGYCDQFQFSRQFQKHIGIAPSEYRKRFRVT